MTRRLAALLLLLGAIGLFVWRAELFTVSRPGAGTSPLVRAPASIVAPFEVRLPRVPVGVLPIASGRTAWLVHYWAPWERHGRAQALALDSLVREMPAVAEGRLKVVIVCFDPFPSVARFVARLGLAVPVVLDHRRELQHALPCPSLPWTWVVDLGGRVQVSQPGEVDWRSAATRELLRGILAQDTSNASAISAQATRPGEEDRRGASDEARQLRAVAASGRANQRVSSAYPPNRIAL